MYKIDLWVTKHKKLLSFDNYFIEIIDQNIHKQHVELLIAKVSPSQKEIVSYFSNL